MATIVGTVRNAEKGKIVAGRDLIVANGWIGSAVIRGFADSTILYVLKRTSAIAKWGEEIDSVYRVYVHPRTGAVDVICLGIGSVDSMLEGSYPSVKALPMWAQSKLAVLSMIEVKPPMEKVEGIGMRIDADTFWVVRN